MAKIIPPVRSEPLFDEFKTPTIRYFEFWEGASNTANEQSDQIDFIVAVIAAILARLDAIELRLDLIEGRLDLIEARLDYLEGLTVVTAVDHTVDNTTTGNQTIRCKADLTVTLTLAPNDRDKVVVKVGQKNTEVIIDGNGRNIEDSPTMTLRRLNTKRQIGLGMEYSAEDDVWYTV